MEWFKGMLRIDAVSRDEVVESAGWSHLYSAMANGMESPSSEELRTRYWWHERNEAQYESWRMTLHLSPFISWYSRPSLSRILASRHRSSFTNRRRVESW